MSAHPNLVSSLHWVQGELTHSLNLVRNLVEQHMETPAKQLPLQQAIVELQQVRGTAAMIQCTGVAAVAEEMKTTLHDLLLGRIQETEAAYAGLLGATVQLTDYIDALSAGLEDSVLVFHPVINELRVARGKGVLTEAELFAEQLSTIVAAQVLPRSDARQEGAAQAVARKYLLAFQQNLLAWLKNQDVQLALGRMGKIGEQVAATATLLSIYQLWRVIAAVVEAVLTKGLQENSELKRLFGRAGAQLKLLAEQGEAEAAAALGPLHHQLLFYVGRSTSKGPRVSALKNAFQTVRLLPSAAAVEVLRQKVRGPNTVLLNRLSEEIRRDLAQVKDTIDLAVRAGDKAPADLKETAGKLRRVADTLNMLGLSPMQRVIENQSRVIADFSPGKTPASDTAWLEVATALLRVEHSLDDALFGQLRNGQGDAALSVALEGGIPQRDVREGRGALLRELLVDLAKIKGGVDQFLKAGDPSKLGESSRLITDIQAGLRVLANDRAAELCGQLGSYLHSHNFVGIRDQAGQADRFADAIACIEYFLEAVQKGEPHTERLIDDLAGYVEKLEIPEDLPVHDTLVFELPAAAEHAEAKPAPREEKPAVTPEDEVDPEIREVFVEEAGEVLQRLQEYLPEFRRDLNNRERLTDIRRAFHTLKGSGRMVGAKLIGEFGWSVENLLNRSLEGTVPLSPEVLGVLDEAVTQLPALVDSFRNSTPAAPEVGALIERAYALARPETPGLEPEIFAAFCEDAKGRLASIRAWLQQQESVSEVVVDDLPVREFHTLRGSAALVKAEAIAELSSAVESYLDALCGAAIPLPEPGFALLKEVTAELGRWVDQFAERKDAAQPDAKPWVRRIEEIQAAVPVSAVEAAADRGLADVFANEAFSNLQDVERAARAWREQPSESYHPRTLRRLFQTLHGAALTAKCAPLGHVAQAFEQRMTGFAEGGRAPGPGFFRGLMPLIEEMYQQLDAFREGRLVEDGSGLAARVFQLEDESGETPPVSGPLEIPPLSSLLGDSMEIEADVQNIEIPPVETPDDFETLQTGTDPELVSIFLGEAEELLEVLDRQFDAWESQPKSGEPLAELSRALHTLKGSARMANVLPIGDVSHRLETLLSQAARGEVARDAVLYARLRNVMDGLHRMLDEVKRGQPPNAEAVLAELESVAGADLPTSWATEPEPATAMEPEIIEIPQVAPRDDDEAAPGDYDAELAEVFRAEAAELLETLESSLSAWQADRNNSEALREIQRALHTFKGGARMAGLMAMGAAAHEMESRVEKIERGELPADAATFAQLFSEMEVLQRQHDRLTRGEGVSLLHESAAPDITPPVEQARAAEPEVETYELPAEPAATDVAAPAAGPGGGWDPALFWTPEAGHDALAATRRETARVTVEHLDRMLNEAGEISIYRSRLEQHNTALQFQLTEMQQTIARVREQLRSMDIETEAQIAARGFAQGMDTDREQYSDFDPLEMDRYSRMQELSRALSESIGDLSALHASMDEQLSEADTLLLQQGRINTEVQQGLMGTLMVPFSRQVQRLQRVVRQTAQETGKRVELEFDGIEEEMDRNVQERIVAPLEHLLRNAVVHGIETPEVRVRNGKPDSGRIRVSLQREGTLLAIELRDDGKGLDYDAIRRTAIERGLMQPGVEMSDEEAAMFIFEPGFSTATALTQAAGRGVGMDVVASEVKQLGGTLELGSETGKGARFLIRLPLTLALSQALLVGVGQEVYAVPLANIESIVRLPKSQLADYYRDDGPLFPYAGREYRVHYLGHFLDTPPHESGEDVRTLPAVLVRLGERLGGSERRVAVVVDTLFGNREIVSKAVGPQVSSVQGVAGATILPDGRVVLVLDLPALVADRARRSAVTEAAHVETVAAPLADERPLVMVVDDSITIRRVTERLLDRHGFRVVTAKDGLDAIAMLQTESPATVLLDIEMPRADGFEVATFIRNSERLRDLPIVMITSRSGEKHRERAKQIGVNRYLIKPYQEETLLAEVRSVMRDAGVTL